MSFNKRISERILSALIKAQSLEISTDELKSIIESNIDAVDSTYPKELKTLLESVLDKISDFEMQQYSENLNTENEGVRDETLPLDKLFEVEIKRIKEYITLISQ